MMDVGVWFAGRISGLVKVLVMLVMRVEMFMRNCVVEVRVGVAVSKMEPYADGHEGASDPEKHRRLLV